MPRGRHRRINHRKPSQTARRTAIGAAVFSTAAGPVMGIAGTAHAAGENTWQAVAMCESSGNWQINTGNGYFGGLQFSESTWLGYGGGQYAEYANEASEAAQIAVAERVLSSQGPGAWPVCGPRAGLTMADAYDAAAPQVVAAPLVAAPPPPQQQQQPAAVVPTTTVATTVATAPAVHGTVTVQPGQSLSVIAVAHHLKGGWQALWRANARTVKNPNLIFPGQKLHLPA
jgi:LysM repeat protein